MARRLDRLGKPGNGRVWARDRGPPEEPYDPGNRYGHLAVSVEDLESEHRRCQDAGFESRNVVELEKDGSGLGKFFFAWDPEGCRIEALQRAGRFP